MRTWILGLAVVALATAPVSADDAALAVVKKAIDAHGGADALNKYKAGETKLKGNMSILGQELDFTGDVTYELPGKFRLAIDTEFGGMKLAIRQITDGVKMKSTVNGMAVPVGDAEKAELAHSAVMQELTIITPLLDAKKYTIKAEADADVAGSPASVILVTAKDMKDTRLYFDKKSGLLIKTSHKGLAPGAAQPTEVTEDAIMSDFKKIDGIMTAYTTVVTHDGKKFMTMTVVEARYMPKADGKLFAIDD